MTNPVCPKCSGERTYRIKRVGLLQTRLWPKLGLFPWECSNCRAVFMAKSRGRAKRRREDGDGVQTPPSSNLASD